MPIYVIWGKSAPAPEPEAPETVYAPICEINQINTGTPIDTILALTANHWLTQNGGEIELRNQAGNPLVRLKLL